MGRVFYAGGKVGMEVPVGGIALADLAEGSVVYLNESENPVEFYVACHNYESGLNGAGRTLVVRKNVYSKQVWNSAYSIYRYADSTVDTWLNEYYLGLFSEEVQNIIGTTTFYCVSSSTNSYASSTTDSLSRPCFLLSTVELCGGSNKFKEGSAISTNALLRDTQYNGSFVNLWTRTIYSTDTSGSPSAAMCVTNINGGYGSTYVTSPLGVQPAFTLPSTALFDPNTLILKGVS